MHKNIHIAYVKSQVCVYDFPKDIYFVIVVSVSVAVAFALVFVFVNNLWKNNNNEFTKYLSNTQSVSLRFMQNNAEVK